MAESVNARSWLRGNGYARIAGDIDRIEQRWHLRKVRTRKNWWDVLAGTRAGTPRSVDGVTFPIIAAARMRKGWPAVETGLERMSGESAPPIAGKERRPKSSSTRNTRSKIGAAADDSGAIYNFKSDGDRLSIRNFAQLENVDIPLRDLVVLVGPQATGKSLALEFLKLVIDRSRIVRSLKQNGFSWDTPREFLELYFGGGFADAWHEQTEIVHGGEVISLDTVSGARARKGEDAVFYIPAHRTLAIGEGWPRPFASYLGDPPYVARRFSEQLLISLNQGLVGKGKIFPHDRRLKDAFRKLIDDAVYHGGTLKLDRSEMMRKRFVLEYDLHKARIPFMAWTAGQREFTPLLLGLYHLLPPGGAPKRREIQWAILEEPEMGLHPKAVVAVMAVVLDLLARGYKVALSTHSPTVLEVVWGMSHLKESKDGPAALCKMMGLPHREAKVIEAAQKALDRSLAVVYLQHEGKRVLSKEITRLNPGSTDPREGGWGGLTSFSGRVLEAVANAREEVRAT